MDKEKWKWILKLGIAVLSAILGALGEVSTGFLSSMM